MPGSKFSKTFLVLVSFVTIGGAIVLRANYCSAQIIPDHTLPNNSRTTPNRNINIIEGGTQAGSNLFHSFQEFSIPNGSEAYFNNTTDIQNIISRVTGSSISNIDGLIRANGTANLFLINPNGINFGSNAQLKIGGSFIGSTASSIKFADGTSFDAKLPATEPLLTVSVPVGLGFGTNPGSIRVQGDGQGLRTKTDLIDSTTGLRVQPNQTLALVGGDLALSGGTLKTAGGRIELGSVADFALVSLTPISKGWAFGYEGVESFKDIKLSQQTAVDASGLGSGDVQVFGRHITLTDGSQIENSTLGTQAGGTFVVTGLESVVLSGEEAGFTTGLGALVYPGATGSGGNLKIETGRLIVRDGARVTVSTLGEGTAGSLSVLARDSIELIGTSKLPPIARSGLYVYSYAIGNAGDSTIKTGRLIVRDGAQVFSGAGDRGSGGNLEVSASDLIEVSGTAPNKFPSTLGASVELTATGDGGNVNVETKRLIIRDGALISTGTSGRGKGGNLSIKADSVEIKGGSPSLFGQGGLSAQSRSDGKTGSLTIEARELSVRDNAQVTVKARSTGDAGFLQINASLFKLDQASITAAANSGEGGNIFLNAQDLRLRDNSTITATAGNRGNGGNITINADTVTVLNKSGITANAFEGRGGNITINATGLFVSPDSRITASSERGVDGTIQIYAPDPNFTKAVAQVPTAVDVPKVGSICSGNPNDAATGEFVNIGSGGIPTTPFDPLNTSTGWHDSTPIPVAGTAQKPILLKPIQKHIEAQGWAWNLDGTVRLTVEPTPSVVPYGSQSSPPCIPDQK